MLPQPLHPAVVHFPIVLVVILPLVAIVALVLIQHGGSARRIWTPVIVVAAALSASAWVAVRTGEAEEEVVEDVVSERVIHQHEEAAELFLPLSAGMLLLAAAGLTKGRLGMTARGIATLASMLLVIAGYRVGHTGGDLVYEHGAAAAYATSAQGGEEIERGERTEDTEREEEGH